MGRVKLFNEKISFTLKFDFLLFFLAMQCFSYLIAEPKIAKDQRKLAVLRIPRQICFQLVAESAHNS